jgi:hypothetical protein
VLLTVDKCAIPAKVIPMDNTPRCVPALTIVITTWNRADMVLNAVNSILAQDCPELLEVVAVDDGSTDSTPAVLQELSARTLPQNRLLQIIRTDRHGRAGSAQRGIDAASSPYVALLSSDDLWEPQRAGELIGEERRLGGNVLIYTGWKTRPAIRVDARAPSFIATVPRLRDPYHGWSREPWVLRRYITSLLRHNAFPYPVCSAVFPTSMLRGRFRFPDGSCGTDHWSAIAGYLQCVVAVLPTTSLVRRTHRNQQHALADANLWPGLLKEQEVMTDAIVHLLTDVTPAEQSMIAVMTARRRLIVLRGACREQHRLACLVGSLGMMRTAFLFPRLWPATFSNVLLAVSPRLHDAIRYGGARRRLARFNS